MKILTYYDRQDDFKIDKAEAMSNNLLGFLRTAVGKRVTVRYDYHGQKQISEEYARVKAKTAAVVLAILLLPLSVLAATIGMIVYTFSSTHGKDISEKKKEAPETPPPPPSLSPIREPELPNPPSSSPTAESLESEPLPPPFPVDESSALKVKNPVIQVQLTSEFLTLNPEEFLELIESRGKDILCLNVENITISISLLLQHIPNIQVLLFNNCTFADNDLSGFKNELKALTKLTLNKCNLTTDHLATLAGVNFSNLTYLDLSYNWIDDDGIRYLMDTIVSSKLYFLDLNENQISASGASLIGECDALRHLEHLDLSQNPIEDEGAYRITALPNLKTLAIESSLLSEKGNKHLKEWADSAPSRHLITAAGPGFTPSEYE